MLPYIYIAYMDPMGRIVNFGVLPTFDFWLWFDWNMLGKVPCLLGNSWLFVSVHSNKKTGMGRHVRPGGPEILIHVCLVLFGIVWYCLVLTIQRTFDEYYWLVVSNMAFIFHNIWDIPSHWLIFFKMVKSTNQLNCRYLFLVDWKKHKQHLALIGKGQHGWL